MRTVGLLIASGVLLSAAAADTEPSAAINSVCPIQPDMPIDELAEFITHEGTTYAVCCNSCKDDFVANPAHWASVVAIQMQAAAAGEPIPVIPVPVPEPAPDPAATSPSDEAADQAAETAAE